MDLFSPLACFNSPPPSKPKMVNVTWPEGEWYSNGRRSDTSFWFKQILHRAERNPRPDPQVESQYEVIPTVFDLLAVSQPYWNMWSLLGLFLSLKYKAPQFATKSNYFARLTAIYGWWCRLLTTGAASKTQPAMLQCTWQRRRDSYFDFVLGHSSEGIRGGVPWQKVVQKQSYDLLNRSVEPLWSFIRSPIKDRDGPSGTPFGNCAETYAFMALMKYMNLLYTKSPLKTPTNLGAIRPGRSANAVEGFALRQEYFRKAPKDDHSFRFSDAKAENADPCLNCEELLRIYQVDDVESRFGYKSGWDDGYA